MLKSACVLFLSIAFQHSVLMALSESESEPSAFQKSLSTQQNMYTNESIVDVGGRKFRKIEYRTEVFYLKLLQEGGTVSDMVHLPVEVFVEFLVGAMSRTTEWFNPRAASVDALAGWIAEWILDGVGRKGAIVPLPDTPQATLYA